MTTILAVTLAAGGVWAWVALIEPRTSTAFCRETVSIRIEIAEASEPADESITAAVAAVAAARAPALVEQAESMGGSTGDEAEAIAAALTEIAASDTIENQRDPMTRFVRLDNEFRQRHCDDDDRTN